MLSLRAAVGVGVLLLLAGGGPSAAQEPSVEVELVKLNATAERLTRLLETLVEASRRQGEMRRLEVSLLALQLRTVTYNDLQGRLRRLREQLADSEDTLVRVKAERDNLERLLLDDGVPEVEKERMRRGRDQMAAEVELQEQRRWQTERSILDLENELAELRRDVDHLEDLVSRGLDGL